MAYSSGLITKPVSSDTAGGDIQQALGISGVGDLGTLCQHPNINIFSKFKPNAVTGYDQPSDATLATNRYGLAAVATNSKNALISMALGWTYHGAQAPYFRQLDFDRYYNGAPIPFMQANGQSLLLDLVSGNASPALFYMLMTAGALANKPFVAGQGIGSSGTAVPSNRLAYCISVEDLGFDSGGGTYHSLMGAYLGLVIFQGTTYKCEVWSSVPVAELSQRENNMFNVPTNTLSLAQGTYTAVACAKQGNYYLPVYNHADYPARFTFVVGGVDSYAQDRIGLALTQGGTYSTLLRTNQSDIYLKMRLYNQTGRSITLNVRDNRFRVSTRITGSRVDSQTSQSVSIDRTQVSQLVSPTSDPVIADGGYVEMFFGLTNIWSNTAGSSVPAFDSGDLTIVPSLQFVSGGSAADFPQYGVAPRVLAVTY